MSYTYAGELLWIVEETEEKQRAWRGEMRLARVLKTYYSCPPWTSPRRRIRENDLCYVIPANNLPDSSDTHYWTIPITGLEEWAVDAVGAYGVGHHRDEIELL